MIFLVLNKHLKLLFIYLSKVPIHFVCFNAFLRIQLFLSILYLCNLYFGKNINIISCINLIYFSAVMNNDKRLIRIS